MSARVRVRDARLPQDEPALLHFIAELNAYEGRYEADRRRDAAFPKEYLTELAARAKAKQGRLFLAEDEAGRAVGWAMCHAEQHETFVDPQLRTFGYVAEMFVEESDRGRHIGRALLAACEKHFRALKLSYLLISSLAANKRAVQAYEAAGYKPYAINFRKML